MIVKIEHIKNIGNYEDYQASGDVALKKMSLIYAENGAGKTTLSRILHSLSLNDGKVISNHYRIGASGSSYVSIKDDAHNQHIFNGSTWNNPIHEIEVFDAHFVANNIYTGFQISSDHRKHLYQFVIGDSGVNMAKKIERVKQLLDRKNTEIHQVIQQITTFTSTTDVEAIIRISNDPAINEKIQRKQEELQLARNNKVILQQPILPLLDIPLPLIEYDKIKLLLSQTIEGIGEEYLRIVQSHIKELQAKGLSNVYNWLHTGLSYANQTSLCPFCGSNLDEKSIIKGYNQYFNKRYNEVLKQVKEQHDKLLCINIETWLLQITSTYKRIEELLGVWKAFVKNDSQLPELQIDCDSLKKHFSLLSAAINSKMSNPTQTIAITDVDNFENSVKLIYLQLKEINAYIETFNKLILQVKKGVRKEEDIKNELQSLNLIKNRQNQPLSIYCQNYQILKEQILRLQKINKELQQQQKRQSNDLFARYGKAINYYLRDVFFTKFQISEIKDGGYKGKSKEASLDYILTFNDVPIVQDGYEYNSFKNVLSEGDKNTIAFSFFLAKLMLDSNLSNKIVIFDDPLSSLDLNRRNTTIHQLCIMYQKCQQVIVLSHNLHFMIELNGQRVIKKADKKVLRIVNLKGKASLLEYDLKRVWINNYQKAIESMNTFVANPLPETQEAAINSIRISLETFLKLKYCCYIPNPDETFGTIVHNLEQSDCQFINPNKHEVIDKLNQLVSISWRTHHASVEEFDLYKEVDIEPHEAQQYVNMTLELLNKEL